VLRYYSPETSEYTVSEGFLLKPESLAQARDRKCRIPEIYVEDCLSVNFNKRLIEKFRAKNRRYGDITIASSGASPPNRHFAPSLAGSQGRSRGWQDQDNLHSVNARAVIGPRAAATSKKRPTYFGVGALRLDYPATHQSSIHRSLLSSKARSFEHDIARNDVRAAALIPDRRPLAEGLSSRRSRSFEHESISNNVFSDDSLHTARQKIKKNMSLSDERYGDKILALKDRSKSYLDCNGDAKIIRDLKKKKAREKDLQLMLDEDDDEEGNGYDNGYDNGNGNGNGNGNDNDNDNDNDDNSDTYVDQSERHKSMYGYESELSCGETEIYLPNDYDFLYADSGLRNYNAPLNRNSWFKLPERKPIVDNSCFDSYIDDSNANEHIYCSIDEIRSSSQCQPYYDYRAELAGPTMWRNSLTKPARIHPDFAHNENTNAQLHRRTKSTDSYLKDSYGLYDNWKNAGIPYDEATADIYDNLNLSKSLYSDYDGQSFSNNEYINSMSSERGRADVMAMSNATKFIEPYYENVPYLRDSVPRSKKGRTKTLSRTESTPIFHSNEDYRSVRLYEQSRQNYARRRNSSCPESREIGRCRESLDNTTRYYDEDRTTNILQSDGEFGSTETVINAKCARQVDETTRRLNWRDKQFLARSSEERVNLDPCNGYRNKRKNSCAECRVNMFEAEESRDRSIKRREASELKSRYRRRNSSCPESREFGREFGRELGRELETGERSEGQREDEEERAERDQWDQRGRRYRGEQHLQRASSKRNVAISDTLEYYEYSMESESQCSENCGFGPCDPRRSRERVTRPGNANSNVFDPLTVTSDTAITPRNTTTITTYDDHHHNHQYHHHYHANLPQPSPPSMAHVTKMQLRHAANTNGDYANVAECDPSRRRMSRMLMDDDDPHCRPRHDDNRCNNRRSSSMPECSDYASQSSSYEKPSRYPIDDNERRNGSVKRGQFTRSFSNTDAPADENVGE
jgi:hypothetical protein